MSQGIGQVTDALRNRTEGFINALPHCRELGMRVDRIGAGEAVLSMPYDERLIGDPESGVIHGGAVSALIEATPS